MLCNKYTQRGLGTSGPRASGRISQIYGGVGPHLGQRSVLRSPSEAEVIFLFQRLISIKKSHKLGEFTLHAWRACEHVCANIIL